MDFAIHSSPRRFDAGSPVVAEYRAEEAAEPTVEAMPPVEFADLRRYLAYDPGTGAVRDDRRGVDGLPVIPGVGAVGHHPASGLGIQPGAASAFSSSAPGLDMEPRGGPRQPAPGVAMSQPANSSVYYNPSLNAFITPAPGSAMSQPAPGLGFSMPQPAAGPGLAASGPGFVRPQSMAAPAPGAGAFGAGNAAAMSAGDVGPPPLGPRVPEVAEVPYPAAGDLDEPIGSIGYFTGPDN